MKLSEIFEQLTYSEFSQLSIGGEPAGVINDKNYARVVSFINLGLTALYTRFCLKEAEVIFRLEKNKYSYLIGSQSDVDFIDDYFPLFDVEEIIKIEEVYGDSGVKYSLNDRSDIWSFYTPSLLILGVPTKIVDKSADVPEDLITDRIRLKYRAGHRKLSVGKNFNPKNEEIELPYTYLSALLYFVASRVHNPIGLTNDFHAGNSYYSRYEKACADLEIHNVRVDQGGQNTRLVKNGWV